MESPKADWVMRWGKYKGKKVREMLNDRNYCQWLKHQDWIAKQNWLWEILQDTTYCWMCNDDYRGMYTGEGDYCKCIECGFG